MIILNALKANTRNNVRELNLFCCDLTEDGVQALIDYLNSDNPLKKITLGSDTCSRVLRKRKSPTLIEEIDMGDVAVGEVEPLIPQFGKMRIIDPSYKPKNELSGSDVTWSIRRGRRS